VQGDAPYKFLWWRGTQHYEVVLDTAAVKAVQHEGADAIEVTFASSHATVGSKVVHPARFVRARVLFDRLHIEGGTLRFRVADFRLTIGSRWWLFPIRLSSGALEQQLNGGTLPLAIVNQSVAVALPDCINTNYEKFKARLHACGDPGQKIGWLSFERGIQSRTFVLDPNTALLRRTGNTTQVSVQLTAH
jgi:hypothetical protein